MRPRLVACLTQQDATNKSEGDREDVHGRYLDRWRFGVLEKPEHRVVRRLSGVLHGLDE